MLCLKKICFEFMIYMFFCDDKITREKNCCIVLLLGEVLVRCRFDNRIVFNIDICIYSV